MSKPLLTMLDTKLLFLFLFLLNCFAENEFYFVKSLLNDIMTEFKYYLGTFSNVICTACLKLTILIRLISLLVQIAWRKKQHFSLICFTEEKFYLSYANLCATNFKNPKSKVRLTMQLTNGAT